MLASADMTLWSDASRLGLDRLLHQRSNQGPPTNQNAQARGFQVHQSILQRVCAGLVHEADPIHPQHHQFTGPRTKRYCGEAARMRRLLAAAGTKLVGPPVPGSLSSSLACTVVRVQ